MSKMHIGAPQMVCWSAVRSWCSVAQMVLDFKVYMLVERELDGRISGAEHESVGNSLSLMLAQASSQSLSRFRNKTGQAERQLC